MLIKIANKWVNASTVTCLDWVCNTVRDKKSYVLYIYNDGRDCCCGRYDTKEGVIKAMDEAAEKINAAQGFKPAAEEKVVMKLEEHSSEGGFNIYRCSHCKTGLQNCEWYKFCPACGREIERWE